MIDLQRNRAAFLLIGLFVLANILWNFVFRSDQLWVDWGSVGFQVAACILSICLLFHARKNHENPRLKRFWLFLALGVSSYLTGSVIWITNYFFLQNISWLTSMAEACWFGQNLFYFTALLAVMRNVRSQLLTFRFCLDLLIVMTAAVAFTWLFLIQPLAEQVTESYLFTAQMLYPIMDLGVLVGMLVFFAASHTLFSLQAKVLLVLGFAIQITADTIYSYLKTTGPYSVGSFNEPLWLLSILLLGVSGFSSSRTGPSKAIDREKQQTRENVFLKLSIPHVSVILLAVYTIVQFYQVNAVVVGLFVCILLVLLRQIVTLVENSRLVKQLHNLNEQLEGKVKERTDKLVKLVSEMEHLAYHDPVTELPNRRFMEKWLERAAGIPATGHKLAFVLLDLDRFKKINDSFGHSWGDQLLKEVGKRLTSCTLKNEVVCRIGGDEFVLLLENKTAETVETRVQAALQALKPPFLLEGFEVGVTASAGIAWAPDHGETADELLIKADTAMYQVKKAGKNGYKVYSQSMTTHSPVKLESAIRKGIERQEFVLHYQPQVSIKTGRVTGAEALIRWNHPDHGLVGPGQFIALAEETGLILPLGEQIFEEACRQSVYLREKGYTQLKIAVNVSPVQLQREEFVEGISRIVKETGAAPKYIELEITESVAMDFAGSNLAKLAFLKQMGFCIALDDFGTGYSSLQYLSQLQIDLLKIDRSFIASLEKGEKDRAIVQLIVAMGKTLRVNVLAEGVETEAQKQFLSGVGCDHIQGYFFSKPLSAEEFDRYLESKKG